MACDEKNDPHLWGKFAYVSTLDGNNDIHRIELYKCADCPATKWVETSVEKATKRLVDADLHGSEVK